MHTASDLAYGDFHLADPLEASSHSTNTTEIDKMNTTQTAPTPPTARKVSSAACTAALRSIPQPLSVNDGKGFDSPRAWVDSYAAIASLALQLRQLHDSGSVPVPGQNSRARRNLPRIAGELQRQLGNANETLRDREEIHLE